MKFSLSAIALTCASVSAFAPTAFQRNAASTALSMARYEPLSVQTGKSSLDTAVIDKYNALPMPQDKVLAEYVWVDAKGECRSKTRTLPLSKTSSVDDLPKWNYDGSSTDQAPGADSEVILKPQRIFADPFRPVASGEPQNILVMCDTYTPTGEPLPTNSRAYGKFKSFSFVLLKVIIA